MLYYIYIFRLNLEGFMEKAEKGISLSEIINIIWKRKILVGTIFIAITAVLLIFVCAYYNPNNATYSSEYQYSFPGFDELKYPDGTTFDYHCIETKEVLNEIKESNSKYSSVDVDKIINKNGIELTVEYEELANFKEIETGNTIEEVYVSHYLIKIKSFCFKNKDIANDFISELINYPINKSIEIVNNLNFDSYIKSSKENISYETQIEMLNNQLTYLVNSYNSLIDKYGNVKINDKSCNDAKASIEAYISNNSINDLLQEINTYGYVKNTTATELDTKKDTLNNKIAENNIAISSLTSVAGSNDEILQLQNENIKLNNQISVINKKISFIDENKSTTLFDNKLNELTSDITIFTNEYDEFITTTYKNNISIHPLNSSVIEYNGSSNVIVTVLGGIILGVIIGSITALVVEHYKKKE